jgi:hypothetical protein
MARTLERFSIARAADGYLLTIEDDSGETIEMNATFDQLDLITEELDRALDEDEEIELESDDEPSTEDTEDR